MTRPRGHSPGDQVGMVTHPACLEHDPGPGHPERRERLLAVMDRLEASGLASEMESLSAQPAQPNDLERIHPRAYVDHVRAAVLSGASHVDSTDANVGPSSFDAALASAGGALTAVDRTLEGTWLRSFVAIRPPGHHAEESFAMGFCLFNNAAIAARRALEHPDIDRVAIVDWDVHHGNGTQHLFEKDPSVFYASLHQFPHYPGTGAASERGFGDGEGATLNCPMAAGTGTDEWVRAFEGEILPALDRYAPQLVIISAGFDAHALDPLSETRLTDDAYTSMTRSLRALADQHAEGRLVSLLEGGYSLEGLALSVEAHVSSLL